MSISGEIPFSPEIQHSRETVDRLERGQGRRPRRVRRDGEDWVVESAAGSAAQPMSGKTVLVTGATGGIGKATAEGRARRGARVGVVGRDAQRAESAAADIRARTGARADVFIADMPSLAEMRRLLGAGDQPTFLKISSVSRALMRSPGREPPPRSALPAHHRPKGSPVHTPPAASQAIQRMVTGQRCGTPPVASQRRTHRQRRSPAFARRIRASSRSEFSPSAAGRASCRRRGKPASRSFEYPPSWRTPLFTATRLSRGVAGTTSAVAGLPPSGAARAAPR